MKRWTVHYGDEELIEDPDGPLVLYADHVAEIATLAAENERLRRLLAKIPRSIYTKTTRALRGPATEHVGKSADFHEGVGVGIETAIHMHESFLHEAREALK
jgi:hypothetical protein